MFHGYVRKPSVLSFLLHSVIGFKSSMTPNMEKSYFRLVGSSSNRQWMLFLVSNKPSVGGVGTENHVTMFLLNLWTWLMLRSRSGGWGRGRTSTLSELVHTGWWQVATYIYIYNIYIYNIYICIYIYIHAYLTPFLHEYSKQVLSGTEWRTESFLVEILHDIQPTGSWCRCCWLSPWWASEIPNKGKQHQHSQEQPTNQPFFLRHSICQLKKKELAIWAILGQIYIHSTIVRQMKSRLCFVAVFETGVTNQSSPGVQKTHLPGNHFPMVHEEICHPETEEKTFLVRCFRKTDIFFALVMVCHSFGEAWFNCIHAFSRVVLCGNLSLLNPYFLVAFHPS